MKQNMGYRLGRYVRCFMDRASAGERALQRRGIPCWMTKIPRYLLMVAAAGLLLTGAFYLFFILVVLALAVLFLSGISADSENDECLTGYHARGPQGPGNYVAGRKVGDDDEDLFF
ncbi:DUF3742 family protein [Citrobacter sp. wls619]|uniref:DUF3742 family protein n=1 Tax=Citrobacter sp. wls619 TaxID=2576432 RepID=UPI00148516C9|nr:DUF3742 family protein [Citrobacter sp. wls619]